MIGSLGLVVVRWVEYGADEPRCGRPFDRQGVDGVVGVLMGTRKLRTFGA